MSRELDSTVVVIGVFDGLHLGHRYLLEQARADAVERGARLLVVTFDHDPDEFFRVGGACPERFKLTANAERIALLEHFACHDDACPADVVALETGAELFGLQPGEFTERLRALANPCAVHVGEGFRYGTRASGDGGTLKAWCAGNGIACHLHALYESDGAPVSSTRIRGLLADGSVVSAAALCAGRLHSICGRVVHGRGEGAGFGFATANLELRGVARGVMLPKEGVYAALARPVASEGARGTWTWGAPYCAAVNVGVAKSFERATAQVEAHLLDADVDLYGTMLELWFVDWIRPQRRFDSPDELARCVTADIRRVRATVDVHQASWPAYVRGSAR